MGINQVQKGLQNPQVNLTVAKGTINKLLETFHL